MPARELVQDPGHHLGVGRDVGRGDVPIRPENDGDPLREAAREPFEFELGELLGIDGDAALGAAERDVHQSGLPGHDGGQAQDFVVVGVEMVADPAFAGPPRPVVLDAVPGEHLDAAVVHAHRNLHLHLAERPHENAPHVLLEVDQVGGALELAVDDGLPRHGARGSCGSGHRASVRIVRS